MKIQVRLVNLAGAGRDLLRVDLVCEGAEEFEQVRVLVERLNGGPVDTKSDSNRVFDRMLRVESVGFDDNSGAISSIAFEELQELP
jgi:hypothetical protein